MDDTDISTYFNRMIP